MSKWLLPIAAALLLVFTACGAVDRGADVPPPPLPSTATATATLPPPPPTNTPLPTPIQVAVIEALDPPPVEPSLIPTNPPPPEPAATPTPEPDWLASVGRTDAGLMFLGNPDAPVTIIDYSDFM
jgi:protein-disulfide isomerase